MGLDNSNCIYSWKFLPISPHVLFDKTVYLTNFLPRVSDYTVDMETFITSINEKFVPLNIFCNLKVHVT